MLSLVRTLVLCGCLGSFVSPAFADFHTFRIEQLYSDASGSVQFIVLRESSGFGGQHVFTGHALTSTGNGQTKTFVFPTNLPSADTSGRAVLIGTASFAALGVVAPDYTVPDGFLALPSGSVDFAGVDSFVYTALPSDGTRALFQSGASTENLAVNFAGQSGSVRVVAPPPAVNYQALWWAAPAESENGWGVNFSHQGDVIFATWFTYDLAGKPWWLTAILDKAAEGVYTGALAVTRGPSYAGPFNQPATPTVVGSATALFSGPSSGRFAYTVTVGGSTVQQAKDIVPQLFATPPTCTFAANANIAAATNYQGLWWNAPPGSEDGWGINLTHQGETIFVAWFTYNVDGSPLWLVAVTRLTGTRTYVGPIYRTSGPVFNAYDKTKFVPLEVGTATLSFCEGACGRFRYEIAGPTLAGAGLVAAVATKPITPQLFGAGATICR
jgi:hypothetical protein